MKVISVNNVSFRYKNGLTVLDSINFDIEESTATAILGKNGSGKSTLLKLLMGFEKPVSGDIDLFGKNTSEYSIIEKSKLIAFVGQDFFNQFDFSVEDYLLFGLTNTLNFISSPKKEHYDKVRKYVEEFDIAHLLYKKMDKISGGEKQIIMICKAFIQGSEIIVLDEPLSALDFVNQNKVLKILKGIVNTKSKTIIFSTHNPNHALFLGCNFLLLDNSKLVSFGNARSDLNLKILNEVYGGNVGNSKDLPYEEFSISND